jgi:flagellar motor component MotA
MIRIILIGITIFFLSIMSFFVLGFTTAKADTKSEAIVGHVITQVIQGNDMDHAEVMTNELAALMHKFSIEITSALLRNMPNILDSISAQLRLELDKQYKCSLQDKDYKNKECI